MAVGTERALRFLSPRAPVVAAPLRMTPLASLEQARLGFFHNSKPNAAILLERLAERIGERMALREVVRVSKPLPTSAAPAEVIEEIVRRCDAVVFASAD